MTEAEKPAKPAKSPKGKAVEKPEPAQEETSLYEKLGGEAAVSAVVDLFYRKVIGDARINNFYFGVNVAEQANKLKAFLTNAFGGPDNCQGQNVRLGHERMVAMGVKDRHFDIMLDHLRNALSETEIANDLINEVIPIAESTRAVVLGR